MLIFRFVLLLLQLTLFILLISYPVLADTHTVDTCTAAGIQAGIDASANGDLVYLDCESGTVDSDVTLNKIVTFYGRTADYKSGTAATTLTMTNAVFIVNPTAGDVEGLIVKDLKFTGTVSGGYFRIGGNALQNFRLTNVWFETGGYSLFTSGYQRGLIDNCRFTSIGAYAQVHVYINEGSADNSYLRNSSLGTADAIFFEDNVIIGSAEGIQFMWSQDGQGYVFRYNSVTNYHLDIHGHCSYRGTREFEIYNNTFIATMTYNRVIVDIRGGTGVVYNNTITSNGHTIWGPRMWLQEIFDSNQCNAATGGVCHGCNVNPGEGRITYQIGVGKDGLDPVYFWGNTKDGDYVAAVVGNDTSDCATNCPESYAAANSLTTSDYVRENTEYYTSAETAKPGYTAYEYPHPLAGGDVTGPTIAQVTAPQTPSTDTTPSFTVSTDEACTLACAGGCTCPASLSVGETIVTMEALSPATYGECTATCTDAASNPSNGGTPLAITSFTITEPLAGLSGGAPVGTGGGGTVGTGGGMGLQ